MSRRRVLPPQAALLLFAASTSLLSPAAIGADGVWVRFRLEGTPPARYHVTLGGYIHNDPWYLPRAVVPEGADGDATRRVPAGSFTPWFDLGTHAGKLLHGRLARSGGVAEFPNVTADFAVEPPEDRRKVTIELATAPLGSALVKRFEEDFRGSLTSFLVSRDLARDAESLETASEMTRRRLAWAREASGGRRVAPERLIVQTSFWSPQRAELNLGEAEVLRLLGFNVVGNQTREVEATGWFRLPGHTHDVDFGPAATRDGIEVSMRRHAERDGRRYAAGVPYNFSDEICARPPIGRSAEALAHFRRWLAGGAFARSGLSPRDLGVERLEDVVPIETPLELRDRSAVDERAARRVFYWTSRFRQEAAVERLRWTTEAFHRHFDPRHDGPGPITSTLVADHPYFSGTGLGMGMVENWTWGGYPLAVDWFALGRARAVDAIGIEDWMGLQYMYGPDSTWEGFQLMGFQASIFRSASRGELPIIAWITPSDERNLRLKSSSALCQGAKGFFYWTYGPTATSTENYWSDLHSAYDGIVAMTRALAAAEPILEAGRHRRTRLALLYSVSSDLWQPYGYVHMLERRGTYLSLVHEQYLVDLLTEEDVAGGRLEDYDLLYAVDPCISREAAEAMARWVRRGGSLHASCGAGSLDEYGEPSAILAPVFGIEPRTELKVQPGRYAVRAGANEIPYMDRIGLESRDEDPVEGSAAESSADGSGAPSRPGGIEALGVIGARVSFLPAGSRILGSFSDGAPAVVANRYGSGRALYVGACPGIAYIKEAGFVPRDLAEKWPAALRRFINRTAREGKVARPVELSEAVVEAGVYDAEAGTVLVLANFLYEPLSGLEVRLPVRRSVASVRSIERGPLEFRLAEGSPAPGFPSTAIFRLELAVSDVVILEYLRSEGAPGGDLQGRGSSPAVGGSSAGKSIPVAASSSMRAFPCSRSASR